MQHVYSKLEGHPYNLVKAYEYALNNLNFSEKIQVAEVGCFLGSSLSYIGIELINRKINFTIHAVDSWDENKFQNRLQIKYNPLLIQLTNVLKKIDNSKLETCYIREDTTINKKVEISYISLIDIFKNNVSFLKENLKIYRLDSLTAVEKFSDNSLDIVCLDDNHSFDHVVKEIPLWFKKVKKNGWLIGDDHNPSDHPGVINAVSNYFKEYKVIDRKGNVYIDNLKNRKGAWVVQKY